MAGNVQRAVRKPDAAARILQAARQLGGRVRIGMKGAARVWIMTRSSA
jgi:hypothetical protein